METPEVFPKFDLLFPRLCKVGRAVKWLAGMHETSLQRLDHYDIDLLASPVEPVTSLPGQPEWDDHFDSEGGYFDRESEK